MESPELGLSVERRPGLLGQATQSVYLFDQAPGGAGYAPQLLNTLPEVLTAARAPLDCPAACERGCSACVLTADLIAHQEIVDRRAALAFLDLVLSRFTAPQPADLASSDALLSNPVTDALTRRLAAGREITLLAKSGFDLGVLSDAPFSTLFEAAACVGATARLALPRGGADIIRRGAAKPRLRRQASGGR